MKTDTYLNDYLEGIRADLESVYSGTSTTDEGEPASMYDYFADALDWNYTIDASGEYLGVRVYVALGGPNVWIDTRNGEIAGAWGTERASIWLPSEFAEEIDSIFEEKYNCVR